MCIRDRATVVFSAIAGVVVGAALGCGVLVLFLVPDDRFNARVAVPAVWRRAEGGSASLFVLDGMRAWAVLWVIVFHCLGQVDLYYGDPGYKSIIRLVPFQVMCNGDMGVDAFFVLSGFLICHIGLRDKAKHGTLRVPRFLLRRFLRIAPAYYMAILLTRYGQFTSDGGSVIQDSKSRGFCRDWWFLNVLFINNYQNYMESNPDYSYCMPQSWSISTEFQFYLLTPPLLLLLDLPAAPLSSPRPIRTLTLSPTQQAVSLGLGLSDAGLGGPCCLRCASVPSWFGVCCMRSTIPTDSMFTRIS
eukprot:TRINITY_DN37545_c0_g2_i1.p1 TRINITY_DN37545_c0_g2~~TRINITY_DN37545_c0_g2_i1.p1  ORF type:complete len:302 (+),score=42.19 TRINITY_DN37545_c0_g2_i1:196-1101(+)